MSERVSCRTGRWGGRSLCVPTYLEGAHGLGVEQAAVLEEGGGQLAQTPTGRRPGGGEAVLSVPEGGQLAVPVNDLHGW